MLVTGAIGCRKMSWPFLMLTRGGREGRRGLGVFLYHHGAIVHLGSGAWRLYGFTYYRLSHLPGGQVTDEWNILLPWLCQCCPGAYVSKVLLMDGPWRWSMADLRCRGNLRVAQDNTLQNISGHDQPCREDSCQGKKRPSRANMAYPSRPADLSRDATRRAFKHSRHHSARGFPLD